MYTSKSRTLLNVSNGTAYLINSLFKPRQLFLAELVRVRAIAT